MGKVLLTTFAAPASSLYYLHKKGGTSCFDFVAGIPTLPEVGSLNLCEILEPYFPYRDTHSSGHVAVASADGGSVNHIGPHSELRTNFPPAASLKCCSSAAFTGHEWADILCSSCFANGLKITAKEDLWPQQILHIDIVLKMQSFYWHDLGEGEGRQKYLIKKSIGICLIRDLPCERTLLGWLSSSPESVCYNISC